MAMELGVPSAELALQYLSSSASDPAAKEPSDEAPPVDRRAGSMLDPAVVVLGIWWCLFSVEDE